MKRIGVFIDKLLLQLAGEEFRDFLQLIFAWQLTVDKKYPAKSKIVKFENKIIYVKMVNHVWLQEIMLLRPLIINKLREMTKIEIENIFFII